MARPAVVNGKVQGFTLVELVMVIVLIGILSALSMGLFANRSAFSPLLAQQQLASAVLLAQQAALAGNSANSLTISQSSDQFIFSLNSDRTFSIKRNNTTISATPMLSFNPDGTVAGGNATELIFSGENTSYRTCISSLGAVYSGSCQ